MSTMVYISAVIGLLAYVISVTVKLTKEYKLNREDDEYGLKKADIPKLIKCIILEILLILPVIPFVYVLIAVPVMALLGIITG